MTCRTSVTGVVIAFFFATNGLAQDADVAIEASKTLPSRWGAVSENGLFRVEVGPRSNEVKLGRFQNWILLLQDAEGEPVFPARFAIGGGMLGHGHGLPTQPRVTGYKGDGLYRIEGMKFNMAGDWTLYLVIETDQGRDQVAVDLTVDY